MSPMCLQCAQDSRTETNRSRRICLQAMHGALCTLSTSLSTTLTQCNAGADLSAPRTGACLALQSNKAIPQTEPATLGRVGGALRVCRGRCKVIIHQKFQVDKLWEAAHLARNGYVVPAKSTMILARAEMGRMPLDQGLLLRFEKHVAALQFVTSQLRSQFHQLKSPCKLTHCHLDIGLHGNEMACK